MTGIVLLRPDLGGCSKSIRHTSGCPFIIGRETDPDMAVVENGIVLPVSFLDLIQALGDQESLDAVACHESQRTFEEVETPECRKLIQHEQKAMIFLLVLQVFRQAATDLVKHKADQRLGPADIRRWHAEIERRWAIC
ncbi:hypothetical protein AA0614_2500 [Komagataeibacter saccharivorans NRIC 0614]|nr:hypothetical protein AA0614_2500 [Komagataeibacter saccharivorans NRIC 0614]